MSKFYYDSLIGIFFNNKQKIKAEMRNGRNP